MKMLTKNKGILIAVAIFIVAMFVYNLFFKSDTVSLPDESAAAKVGDDLLKTYESLQKVNFDQSLFTSPGYRSLKDFSTEVPSQSIGRPNPFANIGRD